MDKFINYIQSVISDTQIENSHLEKFCVAKSLNKSDILLDIGQICNYYYFVNQGVLRFFYFTEDGKECARWVAFGNYFFTETESYLKAVPSQYGIIATEKTEILQIHKNHIDFLIEKYDWFAKFLFYNQQETILNLTKVIESFQNQSIKDRYEELFKYPDFIQKVKSKDLASMLGMSKCSISRIKK
ncbi:Crp/Fnr family transcriptional regulator [Capnocytophaga catalasegens]|uniref:Cyclic nucleotide-binding domain-containing protein n=1 Tax=Capnocytophaga catalasegens TaxID=1004260 RepID=A0AAV5AXM4_9FLAO|nr:Crp/Fnr family transcriptional regulator [Capnocytophaga catalasegens]GIZ16245.1 hypothetical protein RCZ03_22450 [Capnocytophaga catalasegens]GJM51135.1 hypothetical protein RCZ15_21080 [Capnocytophaga catalasegens]GJM53325.1 hypothetical protein RCZ16_16420 [Capnocytophaga catalasegens]